MRICRVLTADSLLAEWYLETPKSSLPGGGTGQCAESQTQYRSLLEIDWWLGISSAQWPPTAQCHSLSDDMAAAYHQLAFCSGTWSINLQSYKLREKKVQRSASRDAGCAIAFISNTYGLVSSHTSREASCDGLAMSSVSRVIALGRDRVCSESFEFLAGGA